MIISGESDIAKLASRKDRREIRNYMRFLRLWPVHGFDMLERPRWQKYLGVSPQEATSLQANPPKWSKP